MSTPPPPGGGWPDEGGSDSQGQGPPDEGGQPAPPPPGPWDQPAQPPGQVEQPQWQPPATGQQWGTQPAPQYAPAQQTSGLAIGALVSSVLGFFCGIGFIIGLVLGYSARKQIRESGGSLGGEGVATAAIIVGWVGVVLMVLGILFFVVVLAGTATL
jgi:hypothetical protein